MTRSSEPQLPARFWITVTASILLTCLLTPTRADEPLPNVAVSLGLKILSLQKQFASKPQGITIFVLGDSNVAKAFLSYVDQSVGTLRLAKVLSGDQLPTEKPDVLFIGDKDKVQDAVKYTRANGVLSMARNEKFISQGVTLNVYLGQAGTPEISVNMSGALLEGVEVNPATLKVARVAR
jgi:hypothetical protein